MTGTFKANNPYNNFLLLLYAFLLKLPMFLHPHVPRPQLLDGFLYKSFLQWLEPFASNTPIIYSVIAFVLLYTQAISINKLVNAQRLMQKSNYLTGMSYLLITSLFADWYNLSSPLIVNSLLILTLSKLCSLHNNNNPKAALFNAGILIGLSTFFYFPSIAFSLLIFVGLGITRSFRLPEWLMVLLGIVTPYYFLGAWIFLSGKWHGIQFPLFAVNMPFFHQSIWAYVAVALVLTSIITGFYFIQDNMRRQLVQTRKSWSLIILYIFVAMLVPFLNASHGFDYWILTAVPIATVAAAGFLYPERKLVPSVLHWGMVAVSVMVGYFLG